MSKIQYIDRSTGNILCENPPAEGLLRFLYENPIGKASLEILIKRKIITAIYGKRMDRPASVKKIKDFVDGLGINMDESVKGIEEFTSFNDFFYRKLVADARPIHDGLISPGDGRLLAFNDLKDINKFYVKGRDFTLEEYLGDRVLAQEYSNSAMIILRLAPNDYHRYHFPYAGVAKKIKLIKGSYYSVSPIALISNFAKVFCENKRAYSILTTQDRGDIIISPVAATMVGSMVHTYAAGAPIKKGDEMGYFAFGGSTIVMLFDKEKFKIDGDLIKNTQRGLETFVKMGEQIAK